MPNHVYSTLYSTGKPRTMERLYEASINLGGGLAEVLIPRPRDQENNWYEWNINNWGTKWGCYDQEIESDLMHFTTAWNRINTELLDKIAVHFPEFIFEYEEETGWGGIIHYKGGINIHSDTYEAMEWDAKGETKPDGSIVYRLEKDYTKYGEIFLKGWYYDRDTSDPVSSLEKIRITEEY